MTVRYSSVYVESPASIYVDGVDVGRTTGELTITISKDVEYIKNPGEPFAARAVKTNVEAEISFSCTQITAQTLALAYDQVSMSSGTVFTTDIAYVGPLERELVFVAGGITWTFDRVVSVSSPATPFGNNVLSVVPVTLRVLIGKDDGTGTLPLVTLGGVAMPVQLEYKISKPKRVSILMTFGGRCRTQGHSLLDTEIQISAEGVTLAEKTTIENLYLNYVGTSLAFTGRHGETATVYFDTWDAPIEKDGLWTISGVLKL